MRLSVRLGCTLRPIRPNEILSAHNYDFAISDVSCMHTWQLGRELKRKKS